MGDPGGCLAVGHMEGFYMRVPGDTTCYSRVPLMFFSTEQGPQFRELSVFFVGA